MTVAGVTSLIGFVLALVPEFSKVEYKWVRVGLFLSVGASLATPLFYLWLY